MYHIAQEVTARTGDNFVLKGGTALLLAYGLPRFSTDLDFDGRHTSIDMTPALRAGADAAGVPVRNLRTAKNTWAVRRYMLHYRDDVMKPLKVEISYRQGDNIDEDDVTTINGIRTYNLDKLTTLKIDALVKVIHRGLRDFVGGGRKGWWVTGGAEWSGSRRLAGSPGG